jgi:hypothetical protein
VAAPGTVAAFVGAEGVGGAARADHLVILTASRGEQVDREWAAVVRASGFTSVDVGVLEEPGGTAAILVAGPPTATTAAATLPCVSG